MAICILLFCEFYLTVLSTGSFVRFKGTPGRGGKKLSKISTLPVHIFVALEFCQFRKALLKKMQKQEGSQLITKQKGKDYYLPSLLHFHLNRFSPYYFYENSNEGQKFLNSWDKTFGRLFFFYVYIRIQSSVFFKLFKVIVYMKTCL